MQQKTMLEVRGLSKHFTMHIRGGVQMRSFDDVSIEVSAGRLLAITGPSGIGKSSLLKCIYRTYVPSEGEVWYRDAKGDAVNLATADEQEILRLRRDEIGYVSQFLYVPPRVPAIEVLMEPLILRGVPTAEARKRAWGMLDYVGLNETLHQMYPSTFSGGEKQRLNILQAIIYKPRLLLLDEPTASLDRGYKKKIMNLIASLKEEGTGMIGVFHDRDALEYLADERYDMTERAYCAVS